MAVILDDETSQRRDNASSAIGQGNGQEDSSTTITTTTTTSTHDHPTNITPVPDAAAPVVETTDGGLVQTQGQSSDLKNAILQTQRPPGQGDEALLQQHGQASTLSAAALRNVDKNWARLRQKIIAGDVTPSGSTDHLPGSSHAGSSNSNNNHNNNSNINNNNVTSTEKRPPHSMPILGTRPITMMMTTESPKPYPMMESSGPMSTGLKGVLGFRTIVVQRTQLRKMEKDVEKVLNRHALDQGQPRSRTVTRMGTGTRGIIPGASYNIMTLQDQSSGDRYFLDELSAILTRWRNLTVEVPCKEEIYAALSKMLLAGRLNPLSRADSGAVLNVFDQIRQLYPLKSDPEDLQDILWCLNLLSPKYACNKKRVAATIEELLDPGTLTASTPLSQRNIHSLLASLVSLTSEQARLQEEARDPRIQTLTLMIMDRIRTGDLGFGFQKTTDRPKQERLAHVAFLRGLAECLRLRDQMSVRLLVQDFIPRYWMEPDSKYPMTMDGPVRVLGQAFSEFLLHAQVRCTDCTESVKSLLQNFLEFFEKKLPPTQLNGAYGKEAITTLIRCILLVFSIEFKEAPLVKSKQGGGIHEISKDGNGHLTSAPGPMDGTAEYTQRTPPGTPRSFGTRSDVFAQTQPPNPSSSQEQVMLQQEQGNPLLKVSRAYLMALWENGHQELIIDQLKIETEDLPLRRVINIYHRLILGSKLSMGSEILTATLNTLFSKLVAQLPGPNEALSELLRQLSIRHRAIFYKPMIACVASDSTQFVTDYLCILACLEMHMSLVDLYMRDVGLICVIVMTDVGPERPRVADASQNSLRWGSCTVGQCVIVLEFIYAIKRLARNHDNHQVEMGKMFLIDLEQRLGLYLSQKEKRILVPRPIRVLLCMILYEIRMLCKTIHRPIWLLRILSWAINHNLPIEAGSSQSGPSGISETMRLRIKHIYNNVDGLIVESKDKTPVHDLYPETILPRRRDSVATQVGSRPAVPVMSSISGFGRGQFSQPSRVGRMADIQLDEPAAVLALLITVHSTIQPNEYLRLSKPLWNIYCLESKPKISGAAAFLFVKCADVDPRSIQILILADLTSEDPYKRQSAIEKLDCLFEHRNSLLLQPFVTDPSSRGPFRTVNVQVPYALPEVGSNRYTMDEPRWLTILNSVGNFPSDIRDKFQELRWGERDKQEMEMIRRVQTPLILSWTGYLDEDYESKVNFGRTFTNPRDRHAMVMLPDLNALNLGTIDLLEDQSVGVRVAALNFLTNYIRNEPLLFVRTFFADMVRKTPERQKELIRRLHLLLSGSSKLPPAFAFALFNHLLGLLKWFQRNSKPKGFDMIEAVLPVLAEMVTSTNDIVFKDFKRNKVDVFFSPLGRFWFRPDIIPESMFPSYATMLVFGPLEIPHQTFQMAMINISQFQFMTNFIARFPLEVAEIQNSVGRFHMLPKLEQGLHPIIRTLGEDQYLPDMSKEKARFIKTISTKDRNFSSLSSLRARAWLCFVLNLIQRMRRSNTDQLELMNLFGGVNLILLEHGGDLGIVGQALDIYVLATTRLRRFFWSHNGYSLIFPALFKIYCDSSANQIVHETINASFYRFYQLHQESFVLQSLGSIAPLMLRKMEEEQLEIMTRHLLSFLEALDQPVTTRHSKALGVQSLAEPFFESSTNGGPQLEIPQWISSFIPRDSKLFQGNTLSKQDFSIADSIKLFLAVIAFDPGSVRSEQFVRIFRLLLPYFLERNPELTTGGLDSLIEVMSRFARSSKPLVSSSFVPPSFAPRVWKDRTELRGELSPYALVQDPLVKPKTIKGKTWAQNDRVAIKHEFLCLIQLFCERGGQLADSQHQHMATLIRSIMKDYSLLKIPTSTDWIKDYIQKVILPVENFYQSSRAALYLLGQISGPIRTYYKSVDYSGLINGLTLIVKDDRGFLRSSTELACMIRDRIVNSGLVVGTKDDWNGASPCSSQARFCSSLVNLILAMINNADLDTIAEIEQSTPTPRLMAYIVIPMCLRFKSRYRLNNLDILEMQFWLRMLGLTIKAAEYDPDSRKSSRSTGLLAPVLNVTRVHKKRSSMDANAAPLSPQFPPHQVPSIAAQLSSGQLPPQTPGHSRFSSIYRDDLQDQDQTIPAENTMNASPGLLIDFIALRIIIVRGERYLSFHPGCWLDVFNITKKHFSIHAFAASIFAGRSGHGSGLLSHANNNSGPASPIIATTPYPSTPRTEWPMTPGSPQRQANTSSLSPFPLFGRTSGDVTPIPGSITARSTVPTTALGYVLWSFAETVLFNRLPMMAMMRPFLLDQLRNADPFPRSTSMRALPSLQSSGPVSPAFPWPSPSIPQGGASPNLSPQRPRYGRPTTDQIPGATPGNERKHQWKSWSKPTLAGMTAFAPIEEPKRIGVSPLLPPQKPTSTNAQPRRRSILFTNEQGGTSATPRISLHHSRQRGAQRDSQTVNKSEQMLPRVLAERANQSMEHVRALLSQGPELITTGYAHFSTSMYPEKRIISGLSPTMALYNDRREQSSSSSQYFSGDHHPHLGSSSDNQLLFPGRYEKPPVSPGFGSMFLEQQAALRASSSTPFPSSTLGGMATSPESVPQTGLGVQSNMSLAVPGKSSEPSRAASLSPGSIGTGRSIHESERGSVSGGESPYPVFQLGSPQSIKESWPVPMISVSGLERVSSSADESTNSGSSGRLGVGTDTGAGTGMGAGIGASPPTISSPLPKKNRSILKPRIITTSPPKSTSHARPSPSIDGPLAGHSSNGRTTPTSRVLPIQRVESHQTDDNVSELSEGFVGLDQSPSVSFQAQADYRVASARTRVDLFLENIEEEVKIILACFPSTFSIGHQPLTPATPPLPPTNNTTQPAAAPMQASPAHGAKPGVNDASPKSTAAPQPYVVASESPKASRSSSPGFATPIGSPVLGGGAGGGAIGSRKTPSITIQDQSFLAPSPINPLPSAIDGGEHLFRSGPERRRSDGENKGGLGSPNQSPLPPSLPIVSRPSSPAPPPLLQPVEPLIRGSPKPNKERRSKSVIFRNQLMMEIGENSGLARSSGKGSEGLGIGPWISTMPRRSPQEETLSPPALPLLSISPPPPQSSSPQQLLPPPTVEVTTSSPPLPQSPKTVAFSRPLFVEPKVPILEVTEPVTEAEEQRMWQSSEEAKSVKHGPEIRFELDVSPSKDHSSAGAKENSGRRPRARWTEDRYPVVVVKEAEKEEQRRPSLPPEAAAQPPQRDDSILAPTPKLPHLPLLSKEMF